MDPTQDAMTPQANSSKYLDDAEPNVSPEEQAQYDQFMANALQLIYRDGNDGGEVRPEVLTALRVKEPTDNAQKSVSLPDDKQQAPVAVAEPQAQPDQGSPPEQGAQPGSPAKGRVEIMALAQATVTIVGQLDDSAKKAGSPITDDVLQHGSLDVLRELAEIAGAAKIHDYNEQDIMGAYAQAIDIYRPKLIADGRTDESTLKEQFSQLNNADQAGKLGEVLPGMGDAAQPPQQ